MRVNAQGYVTLDGVAVHRLRAEAALRRPLPKGVCTLHVNNDRDNPWAQLVICPIRAYHALLRMRLKALQACGDPNARRCSICEVWDLPTNLVKASDQSNYLVHPECRQLTKEDISRAGSPIEPDVFVFPSWVQDSDKDPDVIV
jgi:hypothetical protein